MIIRCRPMRPKDVAQAVGLVASHPVAAPLYGDRIKTLTSIWLRLLGQKAFCPVIFEELEAGSVRIIGAAASVFVNDNFLRQLKAPPLFLDRPRAS